MLEEAFGKAKNPLASAMYYPYRMAIISRLRKKLEVNPSSPKYIQTVKGIGYRFNKEV